MVFYYRRKVECAPSDREDFIFDGDVVVASYKSSVLRILKNMKNNEEFKMWLEGLISSNNQNFNHHFLKLFRRYLQ